MKILTFLPMRIFNYSKSSREFWLFEPKPAGSLNDGLRYVCVPLTTGYDIKPFRKHNQQNRKRAQGFLQNANKDGRDSLQSVLSTKHELSNLNPKQLCSFYIYFHPI
jgi:hypothetical protein